MIYRPEIDGLRALAVLPVIFYHLEFSFFPAGYFGVDVFFVISGFLITTMVVSEIEAKSFSLIEFYERRTRRILPALYFMIIVAMIFLVPVMLVSQIQETGQSLVAISVFISNILFWQQTGYFDSDAMLKPFLHTWSLAVEEQFYIFFPILLLIIQRFVKHKRNIIICILTVLSLMLCEWGWRNSPVANFYLSPTRAWELLSGSIAAIYVTKRGLTKNDTLSIFGLFLIFFSYFYFDHMTPVPSLITAIPVFGTSLVLAFSGAGSLCSTILSRREFIFIGLISYSLYLWHQPLNVFAKLYTLDQVDVNLRIGLLALLFFISTLSYQFVEQPFRSKNFISRKNVFIFAFVGCVLILISGAFLTVSSKYYLTDEASEAMYDAKKDWLYPGKLQLSEDINSYVFTSDKEVTTLFFGDSHAEQYYPIAEEIFTNGQNVAFVTGGGCPPIPNVREKKHGHCVNMFDKLQLELSKHSSIEKIIIAACFNCYFIEEAKTNDRSRVEYDFYYQTSAGPLYFREGNGLQEAIIEFGKFIAELAKDYDVIIIGDNPYDYRFDPDMFLLKSKINKKYFEQKYPNGNDLEWNLNEDQILLNTKLQKSVSGHALYIDMLTKICPNGICKSLTDDQIPKYKDNNHLRPDFVRSIYKKFAAELEGYF